MSRESLAQVAFERDYYRSLLSLSGYDEPRPLLAEALRLLTELTCAREGYIELYDDEDAQRVGWSAVVGCDEARAREIREAISRGIVAEAIATGDVVLTASALDDPRFRELDSVRHHAIENVVCAPIGKDVPVGVVYLQGRRDTERPTPTPSELVKHVDLFVTSLRPLAENLLREIQEETPSAVAAETPFANVIGRSAAFLDVVQRLRFAAPLEVTVLLTGPTGSGKTMLAHAVHAASERASKPFVELNCGALPTELIENELFGAVEGGHSGVPRGGVRGKVEAAEGGTLFLDEVAELPLAAQAKLLQLLHSKTYFPLGASERRAADVRIVAATNAELEDAVAERRFREDLYYRLKVLEVRVPSLADRPDDVIPLATCFARQACERHDLPPTRLSPGSLRALSLAVWPGNVRELAHRVESAVIGARLRGANRVEARDVFPEDPDAESPETLQEATRQFQRRHVSAVLEATDWNVSETARRLDVARSHVYNLIKLHGLTRRDVE